MRVHLSGASCGYLRFLSCACLRSCRCVFVRPSATIDGDESDDSEQEVEEGKDAVNECASLLEKLHKGGFGSDDDDDNDSGGTRPRTAGALWTSVWERLCCGQCATMMVIIVVSS
eukprot:GHVU01210022.1.p3 GENE.GHVU01210022.1~~GHVU01210022.1.p3  ORF type:complete len:115 (-),score=16.93 GHVU01210022.1:1361-1705(-)